MISAIKNFDKIKISIASPNTIREWSYGEVKKPETINYRTLRPERDGLMCERIFGTTKEYECYCGKFKSIRYKGVVCDKCGVEVTHFKVRRERMGHLELAAPVAHIWYYRNSPSRIGLLLNMSIAAIRSVLYFERYVVIDPADTPYGRGDLLTEDEYQDNLERYGDTIVMGIGAEGIRDMLSTLNMDEEIEKLRQEMNRKGVKSDRRLRKRLEIFEDFKFSNNKPEWLIMDVIPVIPPELRPMVQLDGGRFATSDLNDLYRRVINRNIRLRRLLLLRAPDIIIRNEKRMLQEAVDALFDNSRRKKVVKGPGNRPLKSLSDMLKGKQGRFRQNLLGKRVDYSGRSVIVVGPSLKLHQCGLPKKMAIELFKPFIMKKLVERNSAYNIKSAKRLVEEEAEEVWGVLEEVVNEHPVLLNRAPTLHRLGIQAFEPLLIEGKAIQLHPLVCHAYNADFDGDQMAVHVPLSAEAQIEAWTLMLAPHNLLNPANGDPIVNPTQDIVLGINYLTRMKNGAKGEGKTFSSAKEALLALEAGVISHEARIKALATDGETLIETSAGRILFNERIPHDMGYRNQDFSSKDVAKFINEVYLTHGSARTVKMLDDIKDLGYKSATLFGATISVDDIIIPKMKAETIANAKKEVETIQMQYQHGLITNDERAQKVIDLWTSVNERITEAMMNALREDKDGFNPVFMMASSGARGSKQQIRQLGGMRGLMATPSGEIIELPIISNFKEGLTVQEYFISTHGARKGLADTALKTANAGYLTRRLVDVAQGVVISEDDCNTVKGVPTRAIKSGDEIIESISSRIAGHFALERILNPNTGETIVKSNEYIDDRIAKKIEEAGIEEARIRHVLTCESGIGVCRKCYGKNLATGAIVSVGEAVGTIAAQSIGQPGTQLTMRTFHIGGTAAKQVEENEVRVTYPAYIEKLPNYVIDPEMKQKVTARKGELFIRRVYAKFHAKDLKEIKVKSGDNILIGQVIAIDKAGKDVKSSHLATAMMADHDENLLVVGSPHTLAIKIGSMFKVEEGDSIDANEVIANFDAFNEPIIAEKSGVVRYQDIILGRTMIEAIDDITGNKTRLIQEFKDERLQPKIIIVAEDGDPFESDIPNGAQLTVEDGKKVRAGEVIAKTTRVVQKSRDITGGLPRVEELFEAQKPKDPAVIARIDGEVELAGTIKGKKIVLIKNEYDEVEKHLVPIGKYLLVRNGDKVKAGTQLCDGTINPHDILETEGELALQQYLLDEVQEVYRLQGVDISDKHLAIIIRQMLRRVEIIDPGDTRYIVGQFVDKHEFILENKRNIDEGGAAASAKAVLLGLTKTALNTDSFLSAASFQETTKVLTNAAIKGKVDTLLGLKENVTIGHIIPAGTGIRAYTSLVAYRKEIGDMTAPEEIEEEAPVAEPVAEITV